MHTIILAKDGVFPAVFNEKGEKNMEAPQTGFPFPGTLQGEGKLMGIPVLFIRLAGCNLRCIWKLPNGNFSTCDTAYASFDIQGSKPVEIDTLVSILQHNLGNLRHIVISGGEPMLQKQPLALLCQTLKEKLDVHLTMETNGSMFDRELATHIDLFSISPKLANSVPHKEKLDRLNIDPHSGPFATHAQQRRSIGVLQQYIDLCRNNGENSKDFQLKFVVASEADAIEIENDFLNHLQGWKNEDILAMPLGSNHNELTLTSRDVLRIAIERGWRFSPRIHIDIFGNMAGV